MLIAVFLTGGLTANAAEQVSKEIQYEKGIVDAVLPLQETSKEKIQEQEKGQIVKVQLTSGAEAGKVVDVINFFSGDLGKTSYNISDFDDAFDWLG